MMDNNTQCMEKSSADFSKDLYSLQEEAVFSSSYSSDNSSTKSGDESQVQTNQGGIVKSHHRSRTVYLLNIPENASIRNVKGAVKKVIGRFRALSCEFVPNKARTVQLIFKDMERCEALCQKSWFTIFGIKVTVTKELGREQLWFPVYISNLPTDLGVNALLGWAKRMVGGFVAMNKVDIDAHGNSMICFRYQELQTQFMRKCNIDLPRVQVSTRPYHEMNNRPQMPFPSGMNFGAPNRGCGNGNRDRFGLLEKLALVDRMDHYLNTDYSEFLDADLALNLAMLELDAASGSGSFPMGVY